MNSTQSIFHPCVPPRAPKSPQRSSKRHKTRPTQTSPTPGRSHWVRLCGFFKPSPVINLIALPRSLYDDITRIRSVCSRCLAPAKCTIRPSTRRSAHSFAITTVINLSGLRQLQKIIPSRYFRLRFLRDLRRRGRKGENTEPHPPQISAHPIGSQYLTIVNKKDTRRLSGDARKSR